MTEMLKAGLLKGEAVGRELAKHAVKYAVQESVLKEKLGDMIKIRKYDPFRIPPDWKAAKAHARASRISKEIPIAEGEANTIDGQTGLSTYNELIPLGCDTEELSFLSPAYPMYFQFFKWSLLIILVLTFVSGIHGISANINGNKCIVVEKNSQADILADTSKCIYTFATATSLANRAAEDDVEYTQQKLNLLAFILIMIALQFFRRRQRVTAVKLDERDLTASDYTFAVHKIPTDLKGLDIDEELSKFFTEQGVWPGESIEIKKIVLSYDVSDKLKAQESIQKLTAKRIRLYKQIEAGVKVDEANTLIRQYNEKLEANNKLIADLNKEFHDGVSDRFTGTAYISVNTQQQLKAVLNKWKSNKLARQFPFHGRVLKVETAGEPSDVFWENLGVSGKQRTINMIISFFILVAVLGAFFGLILVINYYKQLITNYTKKHHDLKHNLLVHVITIISSTIIVIVNYILGMICQKLTVFEKHKSWSHYEISFATKLTWAQFFNTALITFTVANIFQNYWGNGGMLTAMFAVFRSNCILSPIILLMNSGYRFRVLRKIHAERQGDKCTMNQYAFNWLAEYPVFSFPYKYAEILRNLFTAAFYAPVLPFGLLWTLGSLIFVYWANKYLLLRLSKRNRNLGADLAIEMTEMLEYILIIYAVSNYLFGVIFIGDAWNLSVVLVILAVANAALPMQKINEFIFGEIEEGLTEETYESLRLTFDEDYDRCNPAMEDDALEKFSDEVEQLKKKNQ